MATGGIFDRLTRAIDGLLRDNSVARREAEVTRRNNNNIARMFQRLEVNDVARYESPALIQMAQDRLTRARGRLARARATGTPRQIRRAEQRVVRAEAGVMRTEARAEGIELTEAQTTQHIVEAQDEQARIEEGQALRRSRNPLVAANRLLRRGLSASRGVATDPEGMKRQGGQRGGFLGRAQEAAGYALSGASRGMNNPVRGLGDVLKAAGSAAGGIPYAGPVFETLFKFTGTVFDATGKLKEWGNQLHESNVRFAQFSAAMTAVKVRDDIRQMQLSRRMGDATATTAEEMARTKANFQASLMPIEESFKNKLNNAAAYAFIGLDWAAQGWGRMLGLPPGKPVDQNPGAYTDRIGQVAAEGEAWYQTHGRPPQLGGGGGLAR